MNKRRLILLLIVFFIILGGIFYYFFYQDDSNLTLNEKKWIENNKNKMIDISIQSDVPLFNYNGYGVIFDFLKSFEENTGLEFNKITDSTNNSILSFNLKDSVEKKDIVLLEDYDVLITKTQKKYANKDEIDEMVIGVLENHLDDINNVINNGKLTFKSFKTEKEMFTELIKEKSSINGAVVSKTKNLDQILQNDLYISYPIVDKKTYYVLSPSADKTFNSIVNKYYKTWLEEEYEDVFGKQFVALYDQMKKVKDKDKSALKSKSYVYGFVDNIPYNSLKGSKLIGANYHLIKDFYRLTDIEITYKKYENINSLLKDFENGKVDFMFDMSSKEFNSKINSVYSNVGVIVSQLSSDVEATTLEGLKNKEIYVLKDSSIEKILKDKKLKCKSFDTIKKMVHKAKRDTVLALDSYEFMYYQNNELKNFYVNLTFKNESYGYVINEKLTSKVFTQMFDFYISYANTKQIMNQGILDYQKQANLSWIKEIVLYSLSFIGICLIVKEMFGFVIKPKEKKVKLKKEDKIKYIDQLTSLKNRTYLNDKLPEWEASKVFPQSIIMIDLNNISYINDNFGHEEGDSIICKAANILIQNQMVNSEIIRTSGNEFLIYLVGFDEKQIISYIKKLSKEFKGLPHDFGAAFGYSMIKDEIKTIDDAINESTLDMKNNKEEIKKNR